MYFNLIAILCVVEFTFLVWYEIIRAEDQSDYIDVAARMLLLLGAIAASAAIQAFIALKVRDLIMMTWERYRELRFEQGREQGIEEGRREGRERGIEEGRREGREEALREFVQEIRRTLDRNGDAEVRGLHDTIEQDTRQDPMEEIKQILLQEGKANRELLEQILAALDGSREERSE